MKRIVVKLIKNRGFLTKFYFLVLFMQRLPRTEMCGVPTIVFENKQGIIS